MKYAVHAGMESSQGFFDCFAPYQLTQSLNTTLLHTTALAAPRCWLNNHTSRRGSTDVPHRHWLTSAGLPLRRVVLVHKECVPYLPLVRIRRVMIKAAAESLLIDL
jgi:hypothetical protein